MRRVAIVAVREFVETVKTKMFVISVVLMPMMILGFVYGLRKMTELGEREATPVRKIALQDEAGDLAGPLEEQVRLYNEEHSKRPFALDLENYQKASMQELRAAVSAGELYAFLVAPAGATDENSGTRIELGRKDTQIQAGRDIRRMVNEAVIAARFAKLDPPLDRDRIRKLEAPVDFKLIEAKTGQETTGNELARFVTPFAFMFLMWMATMGISQGLLTSVIEEKNSRVVEVLLSAVSPLELIAGKILGMVMVGGVLMGVWGFVGFLGARSQNMDYLVTGYRLAIVALYFVPGFLFAAGFLGGIGSACNTLKEAQSMTFPLSIITIIPVVMWSYLTEYPNSMLSITLSYIPPITPYVMILRICADPGTPTWQIVTTLIVQWLGVFAVIWGAAKVFRVGVLMYGKPPSPRELVRWLRQA